MIQVLLQNIVLHQNPEITRPTCKVEGCNRLCNKKGMRGNKQRYWDMCGHHVRQRQITKGWIPKPREIMGKPRVLSSVGGVCEYGDCTNKKSQAHLRADGSSAYRNFCLNHERLKNFGLLSIKSCYYCTWDKGTLDLHRINPGRNGGKYERNNVLLVCPNCHRLLSEGKTPKKA